MSTQEDTSNQPRSHPDLEHIFHRAFAIASPESRAAFLDQACAADPALRARIDALLQANERAGSFLATRSLARSPAQTQPRDLVGTRVGPYKLLQVIGEGGFGTVYLAEQTEPIRRKVAIKIIKAGMDSKQVIGRFEAERQALALMDHPHIARVFDGGLTELDQRPYFVMEYVVGDSIIAIADAHRLTIKQRLDLFTQVCQAVQHAHHKGIIHRDLKPGNVLVSMVDSKPFAKVIDFGIAKATRAAGGRLTDKTFFTEHRQVIGTPQYMSPEQAEGSLDIDTRTDVYALGVLLYELLVGSTPFDTKRLGDAAIGEMLRIIREEEPPRPSLKLSRSLDTLASTAACRKVNPGQLSGLIKGELDWIVLKALEKERKERYQAAGNLADDLRRYLSGNPVLAAPPSMVYRVNKFVRRNKALVLAIGTISAVVVLSAGLVIAFARESLRQATIATANAEEAKRQATLAQSNAIEAERQAGIALDAEAFTRCATYDDIEGVVTFSNQPTPAALRHLSRLSDVTVRLALANGTVDETLSRLADKHSGLNNRIALDLSKTKVTADGLRALAEKNSGLTNLQWLDLSRAEVTVEALRALSDESSGLSTLTTLHLSHTNIPEQGLEALARKDTGLRGLNVLVLRGATVTEAGIRALADKETGLKNLTLLDLDHSTITDAGLEALADKESGLKNLELLKLQDTDITDRGIAALASKDTGLVNLTCLDLFGTRVTAKGVTSLADKDSGLKSLTMLALSGLAVTDNSLKALASRDSGLKKLTTLDISSYAGVRFLVKPRTIVDHPAVEALNNYGTAGFNSLPSESGLTINIANRNAVENSVTDDGFKALTAENSSLQHLTYLGIEGLPVTDETLKQLAAKTSGLRNLTEIVLHRTDVSPEGLAALAAPESGLKNLTELSLISAYPTKGLMILAAPNSGLKSLTKINVVRASITAEELEALAAPNSGLEHLTEIDFSFTNITDNELRALTVGDSGLKMLSLLKLLSTKVTNEGVAAFKARFPRTRVLFSEALEY
jgi:serine/threonine protein kinase